MNGIPARAEEMPAGGSAAAPASLAQLIQRATGDNVFRCYHCVKCTSGCPLADQFDLTPTQVIRSLQLDDARVFESRAIWLCAGCYICTTRCPVDIDVASVMRALCIEGKRRGVRPAIPDIDRFNSVFALIVKWFGRIHELTLVALFNLARRKPFGDWKTGIEMLKRGRLRLIPRRVRQPKQVAPQASRINGIDGSGSQVAYFPGCSADSHAVEYDRTARASARALGIELVEPPNWTCCGSCHVEATAPELADLLPMRTLTSVERMGMDTVTSPCSECFIRLRTSAQRTERDPRLAAAIEMQTGYAYRGKVEVQHLLSVIMERAGTQKIRDRVKKPLKGLNVACYYGCLMTRPPKITEAAHPEYPMAMDELLRALGAEPVAWSSKTECCGNSLCLTQPSAGAGMTRKILEDAHDCGAEAVVAMCPLCHTNLDVRQAQLGLNFRSPVLYATQLMTLAFGLGAKAAELSKHSVDPRPLLEKKHLLD